MLVANPTAPRILTLKPGSFSSTGFSESKRALYFVLSIGVTAQLCVLGILLVGDPSDPNDPTDVADGRVDMVEGRSAGTITGGCSPCKILGC